MDQRQRLSVKGALKRVYDLAFAGQVQVLRMARIVDFPVPPNHNMRTTSSKSLRHYYESGLRTYLPIFVAAEAVGFVFNPDVRILDFGCGAGRQLLHFTRRIPGQYSACDVNFDVMKFIKGAYPSVDIAVNDFDPPLKWSDASFDLIYSVSIYSHLSPADAQLWANEIWRVLKPGGLFLPTFNGVTSLENAHRTGSRLHITVHDLDSNGLAFDADEGAFRRGQAVADSIACHIPGIKRLYGETYYSAAAIEDFFKQHGFEVAANLPGVIDHHQDLLVLRKQQITTGA